MQPTSGACLLPAVANAVAACDARIMHLPLSAERVLAALDAAADC